MADILKNADELGHVLVQVQDDLRQLKRSLGRITIHEKGETLDIQALDTAIRRTECGIRRHAEEYLKTVNKQVLTLPSIEDLEKKTVQLAKWRPPLETIPDMRPQKAQMVGPSPGEKHKASLTTRLLCNPVHPKNRDVMHQSYGIQLPDLRKRTGTSVPIQRVVTGPTVGSLAIVRGGSRTFYLAPPLSEEDMRAGIASLVEKGLPHSAADLCLVWTPVKPKPAHLHPREDGSPSKMGVSGRASKRQKDVSWSKGLGQVHARAAHERPPTWTTYTPPPSATSKSSDNRVLTRLTPLTPQCLPTLVPTAVSKFSFSVAEGRIDPAAADFLRFRQQYWLSWAGLAEPLRRLERLLRDFAVPLARVHGERLAALAQSGELPRGDGRLGPAERLLLSALENGEEVRELVRRPGRRYAGEGGAEAAAVRVQACWRRHVARAAYLLQRRHRWAAGTIGLAWLLHAQLGRVRRALQASRLTHLLNHRSRATHLAANWKHISSSRRTIIHIPSLGYSQSQRLSLRGFDILQNTQMGRLCDVRDENVDVIYVVPVRLGEDLFQYYTRLLGLQGAVEQGDLTAPQSSAAQRCTILMPEAQEFFPTHNMCLSTVLKYSPCTLRRIRNLIQGKQAYIVGGVTHVDDLAVADELGVPILGPEPAVAQLYTTKSGARRVFTSAGVSVPPGQWDIYTLQQLHGSLAQLMTDHMEVQRWLFKMDSELGGRGTAFCDVCHLRCLPWAQLERGRHGAERWSKAWAQEPVLIKFLEEVPDLLAHHARPSNTSCYPTWACFLEHFLRQGGVIEAYPPSDSVTCLSVDLLVEPGGEVRVLSCGDQLHGPGGLESVGSTVPQTSVCPDALHAICARVGKACQQRAILGHLSIDLVTFLDPSTLEQQVWAIDLDLGYSNQLAMTQLMLIMTGGTLDCRASRLEVPPPVREDRPCPRPKGAKAPAQASVTSRYAVIASRLLHTNLSMVHYSVFFQMCKAQGIGFDIKERQGTVFALHDSAERYSLGMVTISEDLQGALLTFARNLSVIHQEISAPNMQGETNFKDLIKDIEGVLGMTIQNKTQGEIDEEQTVALTP